MLTSSFSCWARQVVEFCLAAANPVPSRTLIQWRSMIPDEYFTTSHDHSVP
jgi:hypothetical protein